MGPIGKHNQVRPIHLAYIQMATRTLHRAVLVLMAIGLLLQCGGVSAQNTNANIAVTRHNLSASGTGPVKASSENQICVFCHTPHAANAAAPGPLWNRTLSSATYTTYTSNSLDAETILGGPLGQPGGSSKLCLSCHDGSLAIGQVTNGPGSGPGSAISMQNASGQSVTNMPGGGDSATGFTRNLGTGTIGGGTVDLTNDHPISFTFDGELATRDRELRAPPSTGTDGKALVAKRTPATRPHLPLDSDGQLQCTTCHDPHLDASKFLRLNRFQGASPPGSTFNPANDQVCVACHDKKGWAQSVHAVATNQYSPEAATQREFPTSTTVREAGCLNCHDTHTVPGARRLLREGTDNTSSPKQGGGKPAIEETCYQCHSSSSIVAVTTVTGGGKRPQDIKADFTGTNMHMPITTSEQAAGTEAHDISGKESIVAGAESHDCSTPDNGCGADFIESREKLGLNSLTNRHAECTDCHNPHRARRSKLFSGDDNAGDSTHQPGGAGGNIASGALRGTYGVEPLYSGSSFFDLPSGYTVKRGDPTTTSTEKSSTWVTREYQICLKCHSDYAYDDDNVFPSGTSRPELGSPGTSGTEAVTGRKNYTRYTNQAREFQPNDATGGTGAGTGYQTGNKRSWHPVVGATGRTLSDRNITSSSPWLAPWTDNVGTQTMHCSDCHGSNTGSNINPATGKPWGPHGSANNFILKGIWGPGMGGTGRDSGVTANLLCFKCHDQAAYTTRSNSGRRSGFYNSDKGNLHNFHVDKIEKIYCTWCHVAVPHGWKNKMLLANLNDVGQEAGQSGSKEVAINGSSANYSEGPYYARAKLKILTFAASGSWSASNCGSKNTSGTIIANSQGGTGNTSGSGKNWMTSTCSNPP